MDVKVTLAAIGTLVGIATGGVSGVLTIKKSMNDAREAAIRTAIENQQRDQALNYRIGRLEMTVRIIAMHDKNKDLLNQIMTMRSQQVQSQQTEMLMKAK